MSAHTQGFTFVELIVVTTIIVILSTIGFVNYTSTLGESRNTARISDMASLKISLKNHKLKQGSYPNPGNPQEITSSGVIIYQGWMDEDVNSQEIIKKPIDPFVDNQYYMYSTTLLRGHFQIAMSLEKENEFRMALVDGDYQQVDSLFPTLVFASGSGTTFETLSGAIILNKGTFNLPYDDAGKYILGDQSFSSALNEPGVEVPKYCGFMSCQEIIDNDLYMGSGSYCMTDTGGTLLPLVHCD